MSSHVRMSTMSGSMYLGRHERQITYWQIIGSSQRRQSSCLGPEGAERRVRWVERGGVDGGFGGEAADTKNDKATDERAAAEEEKITEDEVEEEEGEEETELEARAPPG